MGFQFALADPSLLSGTRHGFHHSLSCKTAAMCSFRSLLYDSSVEMNVSTRLTQELNRSLGYGKSPSSCHVCACMGPWTQKVHDDEALPGHSSTVIFPCRETKRQLVLMCIIYPILIWI
jgi:hypothetical protein